MGRKMILVNTDFLNLPEDVKEEFVIEVKTAMMEKYAETGVYVTDDSSLATQFILEPDNELRVVAVHNTSGIEGINPDALGVAIHGSDIGFVSVNEFHASDLQDLAQQVGTVASHEAGHLLLPPGHSGDGQNLMSDGEQLNDTLQNDNGRSLEFTQLQKAIIRGDIPIDGSTTLGELEHAVDQIAPDGSDQPTNDHGSGDVGDGTDVQDTASDVDSPADNGIIGNSDAAPDIDGDFDVPDTDGDFDIDVDDLDIG